MRIEPALPDPARYERRKSELEVLLARAAAAPARPCPDCALACPRCGSRACVCVCSPACPEARRQLSSDPDAHPIEPGILALVYHLNRLGGLLPCWSCEGHDSPATGRMKLPQVWAHVGALAPVALIAGYLADARAARRLRQHWEVRLVAWGQGIDDTVAIAPRIEPDEPRPALAALQADAGAIADGLVDGVRALARRQLARIERALAGPGRIRLKPPPARPRA